MPSNLNPATTAAFQKFVYNFYATHGRHDLPWRQGVTPYQIMVSEIMLQQTQVDRVFPKFLAFVKRFPTADSLAVAQVADIIRLWQGLGYNRRVLNLQKAAHKVVNEYESQLPQELEELLKLPGIGPYTATAIQAFAFNLPSLVIETNIRAVFIYHFFPESEKVTDLELLPLIEASLDRKHPRKWYSALMDYGSYLKREVPNPTRQSQTYTKQSSFKGSNRQIRGLILKLLTQQEHLSDQQLAEALGEYHSRSRKIVQDLVKEGFVAYHDGQLTLPKF